MTTTPPWSSPKWSRSALSARPAPHRRAQQDRPVDVDGEEGGLRAPGVIEVITEPAGAECWINGKAIGKTPVKRRWHAGRFQVRVRSADGTEKSAPVYVPSGAGIQL